MFVSFQIHADNVLALSSFISKVHEKNTSTSGRESKGSRGRAKPGVPWYGGFTCGFELLEAHNSRRENHIPTQRRTDEQLG